jgi:hypothetical protein
MLSHPVRAQASPLCENEANETAEPEFNGNLFVQATSRGTGT